MPALNRVFLMGNLTRDPQLRYLPSNTAVCEFGLAINRKYRGSDGETKDDTTFVDVSAFGKQAEAVNEYLRKGAGAMVEGRLHFRQWTAEDGSKRSKLSVVADNVQFIGGKGEGQGQREAQPAGEKRGKPTAQADGFDDPPPDDDIPF